MVAGAVAFQLMTWLIPNIIGEAVSVAILGLLLGAVYPSATAVFTKLLPWSMHISGLSSISALGSSGGAVSPFFTGILAQNVGLWCCIPSLYWTVRGDGYQLASIAEDLEEI